MTFGLRLFYPLRAVETGTLLLALSLVLSPRSIAQQPAEAAKPTPNPVAQAREALHAAEVAHPGNTVEIAKTINDLIQAEFDSGQMDANILALAQRGMTVSEAAAGPESETFVYALSSLAQTLRHLSRAAEGRPYAERALEIAKRNFPESDALIWAAAALGDACNTLTDFPCAVRADEEAIAAERKPGPDHEFMLAGTLSDLADVKERIGDWAGAGTAIEESLAAAKHAHPNDPQISILESNLGLHYLRHQQFDQATTHLNLAVDEFNRAYGVGNPYSARVMINLGELYSRTGQFPLAYKNYEAALADPHVTADELAREQGAYARALASGGDLSRAIDKGLLAERTGRETFSLQARILPERQALAYERHRPRGVNCALSVIARHPDLPSGPIYQEVVRSRALVADEMARRQKNLNAANDPEVARLLQELKSAQADLLKAESGSPTAPGSQSAISAAQSKLDEIERSLAQRSAAIRNDERVDAIELADLRHNLPAHSVLISYVAYKRVAVETVNPANLDTLSYMAFVLHPDSSRIGIFDLGDAKTIEDLVTRMRASATDESEGGGVGSMRNERAYRDTALSLRNRIWDPMRSELANAKLALVVPDGMLNLIPFGSLPEGNGYLIEHAPVIHILSSERDLVSTENASSKVGLVAIGSPRFDLAANTLPPSPLRDADISCDEFRKLEFHPLPGTAEEIGDVASTWRHWNRSEPSASIVGVDATRARFLEEAPHSRVLHIATHAFLLDKSCGDGNPLLHSGLVFAGANQGRESALLTAQQIASLDLSGLDWAVLSACNTGNGELHDGEGVLGLERAFRVAGARSVVMALWPVDDTTTRDFMHQMYTQRIGLHASTADAVWNASRKLLLDRRAAGKSTHPWYWSGFVGSGAWE